MKSRVEFIDIAKGISILLVVMNHNTWLSSLSKDINNSLNLIRMPLFFFLSGIFLRSYSKYKYFLIKKSEALLKPYFFVLFTYIFLTHIFQEETGLGVSIFKTFYGTGSYINGLWRPMWFLTHLFVVHCFGYLILRYSNIREYGYINKSLFLLLFYSMGVLIIQLFWNIPLTLFNYTNSIYGLPFSSDLILITSSYFLCGFFLKDKVINLKPNAYLMTGTLTIYLCIVIFTNTSLDLNQRKVINPLLTLIGSMSGIYLILFSSFLLEKTHYIKRLLVLCGSCSLYILIFHVFLDKKTVFILNQVFGENTINYLAGFTLSIILPLFIKQVIEKNSFLSLFFLPFEKNKYYFKYKKLMLRIQKD